MEVDVVTLAAEFPNDNPELHHGATWVCHDLVSPPTAEIRQEISGVALVTTSALEAEEKLMTEEQIDPSKDAVEEEIVPHRPSGIVLAGTTMHDEFDDGDEAPILVEEITPFETTEVIEERQASAVAPEPPPPETVKEVIASTGDDPFRVLVTTLTDIVTHAGGAEAAEPLAALLTESRVSETMSPHVRTALEEGGFIVGDAPAEAFVRATRAWSSILRGVSEDFEDCGGTMLDEWASDLLSRMMGAPSRAPVLRRELRARGIAAFGLVEAA